MGSRPRAGTIDICESDVFEWLCRPRAETADVTIANLFLHHFREGELAHLLNLAAAADDTVHRVRAAAIAHRPSPARRCCA